VKLEKLLETGNLVNSLDDDKKSKIIDQVKQRFNYDTDSRKEKQDKIETIVKLALSVVSPKSYPWAGASNVNYPLISTASIDFGAKCSPEILRDDFICKAKIIGKDDGKAAVSINGEPILDPNSGQPVFTQVGVKQKRGDRVSTVINYQLTDQMENWVPDMDKLLVSLPVTGTMFKKTYEDSKGNPISELIYPDKLVLHDKTTNFEKAPKTHIQELYVNEIQERIRKDVFIDFVYDEEASDQMIGNDLSNAQDGNSSNDLNSGLHIFLEQCCWIDLDEDGFLEPYVATVHSATDTLVNLSARFKKEDVERADGKIVGIKAINPYTPYIFIPSLDGSFYGIGLGHLLLNLNKSINTSINQLTDAGTLQTTGGGFIAKSLKIRGGSFKMKPNEYKNVDSNGGVIRDSIVPLPTPQPSQTIFALLGFLSQSGDKLGSLRDVFTGENAANISATTTMAMTEQGVTQFKAIYKRVYRSLKSEFRVIYNINSSSLSNNKYAEILDEASGDVSVKLDFSKKGFDIVPVADGASVTNSQRVAKSGVLMQFLNDPYVDQILLRKKILSGFDIEDYQDLIVTPPPPEPNSDMVFAQAEMVKAKNKLKEVEIKGIETGFSIERGKYDIEKTLADIEKTKSEAIKNISDAMNKEKEVQISSLTKVAELMRTKIEDNVNKQNESNENNQNNQNNQESTEERKGRSKEPQVS